MYNLLTGKYFGKNVIASSAMTKQICRESGIIRTRFPLETCGNDRFGDFGKYFIQRAPQRLTQFLSLLLFVFLSHSTTLAQVSIEIQSNIALSEIGKTEIMLDGNWLNNGTFVPDSSKVTFIGAANQTITNPNGENFHNVTVNKSGGDVQMNGSNKVKRNKKKIVIKLN